MSDLWFNIRFGVRHFQWGPRGVTFKESPYHKANPPKKWIEVYCWFGTHRT